MALRFSEYFWGKNSFEVLDKQLEQGKESLKLFSSLMIERSNAEKNYVKSLENILKSAQKLSDYPNFENLFQNFRNSLEATIGIHSALILPLKDDQGAGVEAFKEDQKKKRKMIMTEASKLNTEFKNQEATTEKLKEKYHKLAKENEANQKANEAAKQTKPKDQIKIAQKAQKSQLDTEKAETEYKDQVSKFTTFIPSYQSKIETFLNDLQQMEEDRLHTIKQHWVKYGHLTTQIEPTSFAPQIIQHAENINVDSCLTAFVHDKQTGTSRPIFSCF
eukprot:TRINITY_DN942_c0_g1_i1.p1 TRINITY_DN942_c0_g1~~TRINITY_DN942_c0_g1_i1.p1  ORF type:complete len:276 (-),score=72.50 TRINITY_DN942_c0_g1_i1:542-1369(-)